MNRTIYVAVICALVGLTSPAPAWGGEESAGTAPPTFEPSAAMAFYRALCSVDEVGGAGVGNCFREHAQVVRKKYELLHSRLIHANNDLCDHQKGSLASAKKAYKTYLETLCLSADENGNTHGFVERQHCILELTLQAYKNLLERSYTIQKAWECKE